MSERRLPVYLLLDCSESMAGTAIEEVARGVDTLVATLRKNPLAVETAYLSVITFSRYAKQVVPLTELALFQPPKLSVRAGTACGAAIELLLKCLNKDIVRSTPTSKGDYRPIVFLMTDGQPTDDWQVAASALRGANNPRIANIYAIGCGPDVDFRVLHCVTDIVLNMNDMSADCWRRVFLWLSASVNTASTRLSRGDGQVPIDMPTLPEGLELVPAGSQRYDHDEPRQVFLQARCCRIGKPYLMRFIRLGSGGRYVATMCHPLEEFDDGDMDLLPPVNSSQLAGCPPCPHCKNSAAAMCECGALFCDSEKINPKSCPVCHASLRSAGGGSFDIQRSQG